MNRCFRSWLVCLLPILLGACGGPGEPVASLTLEPQEPVLPFAGRTEIEASWEPTAALARLKGDPQVFLHLLDDEGGILRTFDHRLPFDWQPGTNESYAIDMWQSAIAEPLKPGSYRLSLGLYDLSGRRWPLVVDGEEIDDQEYVVARVTVPPLEEAMPAAVFSDGWLPTEAGLSKQTPAVRWLVEDGSIELQGLPGAVDVHLTVAVPRLEESGFHAVKDEGIDELAVVLRSECLANDTTVSGHGSHEITLALTPVEGSTGCTVDIDPAFVFLEKTNFEKRSVVLEKLVWEAPTLG